MIARAGEVFPGARWLTVHGRSENFLTTMCRIDDPPERAVTSDGAALAGVEVRIVDADGQEVPRGTEGDIAYWGSSHMLGYHRDPEQTAALFTPGASPAPATSAGWTPTASCGSPDE